MTEQAELNQLFWHSRRGMLELDLLLVPYVREVAGTLEPTQLYSYRRLLECEDTELFQWFMGTDTPSDPELADIVDRVLKHNASRAEQH